VPLPATSQHHSLISKIFFNIIPPSTGQAFNIVSMGFFNHNFMCIPLQLILYPTYAEHDDVGGARIKVKYQDRIWKFHIDAVKNCKSYKYLA
jgi:hypothetical protein